MNVRSIGGVRGAGSDIAPDDYLAEQIRMIGIDASVEHRHGHARADSDVPGRRRLHLRQMPLRRKCRVVDRQGRFDVAIQFREGDVGVVRECIDQGLFLALGNLHDRHTQARQLAQCSAVGARENLREFSVVESGRGPDQNLPRDE